jgi:hypothetical protein
MYTGYLQGVTLRSKLFCILWGIVRVWERERETVLNHEERIQSDDVWKQDTE